MSGLHVRVRCSPDADDLFMMRALLLDLIDTRGDTYEIDTSPTDALNRLADTDAPEVLAISVAHYPHIADRYQMLPHGGSMGEGYGPVVVAPKPMALSDLTGCRVAIPGLSTTAWHVLRMMVDVEPVVTPISPYHLIFDALREKRVDAGLIIHEGRLTYEDEGFVRVADLGEWWNEETGALPLPLGGNTIRRDLGPEAIERISATLRDAIAHGLEHRDDAIAWLLARGGALKTHAAVDTYLGMYANARTLDYGDQGRKAMQTFMDRGAAVGLFPQTTIDYAP